MTADPALAALAPLTDAPALRGDPETLRERARRDGYLAMRGLLERGAVLALRAFVLAECERLGWLAPGSDPARARANPAVRGFATGDPATIALLAAVLPSAPLERLRRDEGLAAVLAAVLGGEVEAGQGDVCRVVFPGAPEHTTPPHQDGAYVGTARECWTAWIPLGDCPLALGPLALLPGSHRAGLLAHDGAGVRRDALAEGARWAASDLACGDALLFHALTLHRALPNVSGGVLRLSVDCRYRGE